MRAGEEIGTLPSVPMIHMKERDDLDTFIQGFDLYLRSKMKREHFFERELRQSRRSTRRMGVQRYEIDTLQFSRLGYLAKKYFVVIF